MLLLFVGAGMTLIAIILRERKRTMTFAEPSRTFTFAEDDRDKQ